MKKSKFSRFYLCLICTLGLIFIVYSLYVFFTLKNYEANVPETFIYNLLINQSNADLSNSFAKNSTNINDLRDFFISQKYTLKAQNKLNYQVYNGTNLIYTIKLSKLKKVQKLGLLKYNELKLDSLKLESQRGLYYYTIIVPDNFKVLINNQIIDKKYLASTSKISALENYYNYTNIPNINTYNIDFVTKKPQIKIINSFNETIKFKNSNIIDLSNEVKSLGNIESLNKLLNSNIDVKEFAENWDLYLTRDLSGSNYGYYKINNYFVPQSEMSKKAYEWAHNIDITFMAPHTLNDPIFTNETITNFKIYNENIFTCDVYIEKNITVTATDDKKIDKFKSTITYVKYNGEWKIASLKSIV